MTSKADALAYISGDKIECLECGKKFVMLDHHIRSRHGMSSTDYRDKFNIPASIPLAGAEYREKQRQKMLRLQRDGSIDYSHLNRASDAARAAGRGSKRDFDRQRQAELMKSVNDAGKAYRKTKARRSEPE